VELRKFRRLDDASLTKTKHFGGSGTRRNRSVARKSDSPRITVSGFRMRASFL